MPAAPQQDPLGPVPLHLSIPALSNEFIPQNTLYKVCSPSRGPLPNRREGLGSADLKDPLKIHVCTGLKEPYGAHSRDGGAVSLGWMGQSGKFLVHGTGHTVRWFKTYMPISRLPLLESPPNTHTHTGPGTTKDPSAHGRRIRQGVAKHSGPGQLGELRHASGESLLIPDLSSSSLQNG